MLNIETLILIANLCLPATNLDRDVKNSIQCNDFMIKCIPDTYKRQFVKDEIRAFNSCYIDFEVSKP